MTRIPNRRHVTASLLATAGGAVGGALLARVDRTVDTTSAIDPATGAISRDLPARVRERYLSIADFGAFGGDAEKDTAALEAACAWANGPSGDGRPVYIPPGRGSLKRTINHYSTLTGGADIRRAGLVGETSGVSQFVWVGSPGSGAMINWGTLSTDSSEGQFHSHARLGGFTLDGAGLIATGLRAYRQAWFMIDDVRLTSFTGAAYHSESCASYSIRGMRSFLSATGALFDKGLDPTAFTTPNAIVLLDCTFGSQRNVGVDAVDCGPLMLIGGSIEGCGSSLNSPGGLHVSKTGLNMGIEAMMLRVIGTYFENNLGLADVLLSHDSRVDAGISIDAANFNRISSSRYTLNNIAVNHNGIGAIYLGVRDCSFNTTGSYLPNAGRKFYDITGIGTGRRRVNDPSNIFGNNIEIPTLNLPGNRPNGSIFCSGFYDPTASAGSQLLSGVNTKLVTHPSTGIFNVFFQQEDGYAKHVVVVTPALGNNATAVFNGSQDSSRITVETRDGISKLSDSVPFTWAVYAPGI